MAVGGTVGHCLCTGLAVIGGRMIAQKISVRTGESFILITKKIPSVITLESPREIRKSFSLKNTGNLSSPFYCPCYCKDGPFFMCICS